MNRFYALLVAFFVCAAFTLQAQNSVEGKITDAETGEGLIGASVVIKGSSTGTTTDAYGQFTLTSSQDFPWTLEISYTGYEDQEVNVSNGDNVSIALKSSATLIGGEVVISVSRKAEKVQDAPASITVINARKLAASPNENPARNLVNAPGVTVQQQSAGRINIQLRGDGGIFGSASFPMLDYRALSGPGLGTFDALNSPLNNLDLETIEIVRGPGSALYGPGVTSGVVHFISKSPIDKPGTTVQLLGGELNTIGFSARHATKVSDKFGFKINAVIKRGGEFVLDPNNPDDAARIALLQDSIYRPAVTNNVVDATQRGDLLLDASQVDTDGDGNPMQPFWNQAVLNGTLEFRPQDDMSINVAGGFNTASSVFFNSQGEGLNQAREFWGQARFQKGGLFAQAFYLTNDGGRDEKPTFLYQTGNITSIIRQQFETQIQYNFDLEQVLNSNWTAGFDYRLSTADTRNFVYGRNEEDDNYGIAGAYLQGDFQLVENKLDLVLAARGDRFSFTDEFAFTPRAVLVYKPAKTHTIRFGYNRAVTAPSQLNINIDFPVSTVVPGAFDIWLYGNGTAQTFDNPVIKLNGVLGGAELPIGTPGLPNAVAYGAVNQLVLAQLIPGIEQATGSAALAGAIEGYLLDPANTPGGTTGTFAGINLFNGQPLAPATAPAAQLQVEDTWELGYKGLIQNKLAISLDIYNRSIDGAILFTAISPSYTLLGSDQIGADLGAAVGDQDLQDFIFGLLEAGNPGDPANSPTAAALTQTIAGAYAGGGDAFAANIAPLIQGAVLAATPTDQVPQDGITHVAAGYRTFESYSYTGIDFGAEYYINEDLSVFGNYSYISDNLFEPIIKGTDATEQTFLSAPIHKFRLGGNYVTDSGWRGNLAYQYDQSYQAFVGQYSGETDVRSVIDLGVGYKFDFGLTVDVSAQNLLNNKYRAFPGMPEIGRRTLVTLTYDFGGDDK